MKTIVRALTEEHKEAIRRGMKNSPYNEIRRQRMIEMNKARRIKLIDTKTGIIYESEREYRKANGDHTEYERRRKGEVRRYIPEIDGIQQCQRENPECESNGQGTSI